MSKDTRHYDTIVAPSSPKRRPSRPTQPVRVQGSPRGDQAADQGGDREAVRRQGDGGEHADPQGQGEDVPRRRGRQQDVKKAVVTLADGSPHRRDQRRLRYKSMAMKTYKPIDAGPSPARHRRPLRALQGQAAQDADRGQIREGRPQQYRPHHRALPRRRPQADLSHRRLQASQVRPARQGRAARIRSQPLGVHRADQIRRRRAGLHHRAAAP